MQVDHLREVESGRGLGSGKGNGAGGHPQNWFKMFDGTRAILKTKE